MSTIQEETNSLVLHIVYDGAPQAGKTESIRSLGSLLDRNVETPEEQDGRTQLFDWLEYEGGQRLGRPISCRVVAVPGQASLARRRSLILSAADAVVFVVDSSPEEFATSLRHFRNLQRQIARRNRTIPIFVQLNKQDVPGALDPQIILNNLGPEFRHQYHATVATEGKGIRESFVFAIGEALRHMELAGVLYRRQNEFSTQEVGLPSPAQLVDMLSELSPIREIGQERSRGTREEPSLKAKAS